MTFDDLPQDWPTRRLDDPTVAPAIVDLCVSDADRNAGGLSVLLCRTDGTLSQPVFLERVPARELPLAVDHVVHAATHLPGVGGLVVNVVRRRGAVTDHDRRVHQRAIDRCRAAGLTLHGAYVVTRGSVTPLPQAVELGAPRDVA